MSDYKIVSTFNKVSHLNGVICLAKMEKYLDKDAETLEELVRLLLALLLRHFFQGPHLCRSTGQHLLS